jgi:hypothetical protein
MNERLYDMIPNGMLLEVSELPKKKKKKRYNKHVFLIILQG